MTETERQAYVARYEGTYFQHQDGGIYQFLDIARYSDKLAYNVVYKHIFPFEPGIWVRPLEEWTLKRFQPITIEYAFTQSSTNREKAQEAVTAHKSARRIAEADAIIAAGADDDKTEV